MSPEMNVIIVMGTSLLALLVISNIALRAHARSLVRGYPSPAEVQTDGTRWANWRHALEQSVSAQDQRITDLDKGLDSLQGSAKRIDEGLAGDLPVLESRIKHLEARFVALVNHFDENLSNSLDEFQVACEKMGERALEVEEDFKAALKTVANVEVPDQARVTKIRQDSMTWEELTAPITFPDCTGATFC